MKKNSKKPLSNTRIGILLGAFVCLMLALAYASVPLYSLFCRATGYGGTTQRIAAAPIESPIPAQGRAVTVSFDGNVDSALAWEFAPDVRSVTVKLGEVVNIKYHARNHGNHTQTGTATYNVQPDKAGEYFDKIQCFCFTRQTIKAGETVELPVQFYVDPAMAENPRMNDVTNITLSYTFFLAKDRAKKLGSTEAPAEKTYE